MDKSFGIFMKLSLVIIIIGFLLRLLHVAIMHYSEFKMVNDIAVKC